MKASLYVRELTDNERSALAHGLRSDDGFCVRRCQILLASVRHENPNQIAAIVGCTAQVEKQLAKDDPEGPARQQHLRRFVPDPSEATNSVYESHA